MSQANPRIIDNRKSRNSHLLTRSSRSHCRLLFLVNLVHRLGGGPGGTAFGGIATYVEIPAVQFLPQAESLCYPAMAGSTNPGRRPVNTPTRGERPLS